MKTSNSNLAINVTITLTAIAAGLLVAWGVSGSGKTTVQGTVQLDGHAVPWADVVFVSEDRAVGPVAVKTDQDGKYEVTSELPPGSYRVMTRGTASAKQPATQSRTDELDDYQRQMMLTAKPNASTAAKTIPETYGALETSPLRTEIVDGASVELNLELKSDDKRVADRTAKPSTSVR